MGRILLESCEEVGHKYRSVQRDLSITKTDRLAGRLTQVSVLNRGMCFENYFKQVQL